MANYVFIGGSGTSSSTLANWTQDGAPATVLPFTASGADVVTFAAGTTCVWDHETVPITAGGQVWYPSSYSVTYVADIALNGGVFGTPVWEQGTIKYQNHITVISGLFRAFSGLVTGEMDDNFRLDNYATETIICSVVIGSSIVVKPGAVLHAHSGSRIIVNRYESHGLSFFGRIETDANPADSTTLDIMSVSSGSCVFMPGSVIKASGYNSELIVSDLGYTSSVSITANGAIEIANGARFSLRMLNFYGQPQITIYGSSVEWIGQQSVLDLPINGTHAPGSLGAFVQSLAATQVKVDTVLPDDEPGSSDGLARVRDIPFILTGGGAYSVIVTVSDGSSVISGVAVSLKNGINQPTVTTNTQGVAIFNVDAGQWSVSAFKSGYEFGGETKNITGNTSFTITMTPIVAPSSDDPGACTIYDTTYDTDNSIKSGVVYTYKVITAGVATMKGNEKTATSIGTSPNNISFTVQRGCQISIKRGNGDYVGPLTVPDTPSASLKSMLEQIHRSAIIGDDA